MTKAEDITCLSALTAALGVDPILSEPRYFSSRLASVSLARAFITRGPDLTPSSTFHALRIRGDS